MSEGKRERPLIVPIFIPNQGCPNRCIFCQQEKITDHRGEPINESTIKRVINQAIGSSRFQRRRDREVAFYGGTFTRLSMNRISELLAAVRPYIRDGIFQSIRVSTRPDAVDVKRMDLMRDFDVSTVELGVQSMDEGVLRLSRRGHTARDTIESVQLLRRSGFKVGVQLMPGLPGDSIPKFRETVDEVIRLRPDMVRLYPALVIKGTELAEWYKNKRYKPLMLEEAVEICKDSCLRLEREGIPVIRIGLMSSPSLLREGEIVAGPWHEALGFLVRSEIHQEKIKPYLPRPGAFSKIKIRAPLEEIPLIRGHRNSGLHNIEDKTRAKVLGVVADNSVPKGRIMVDSLRSRI